MIGKRMIVTGGAAWMLVTLLLPGCARGTDTAGTAPTLGGSASPAGTASPRPETSTTITMTPPCTTGERHIEVRLTEMPTPICVHVGDTLVLAAPSAPPRPDFTTSDVNTLNCTTAQSGIGTVTATCHAGRAGEATVRAASAPPSNDPHGPLQSAWQLTVRVVP
jgi:hypothetical protein